MEEIITLMEDLNINKIKQIIYILCDNKKIKLKDISTDFFIFLLNLSEDDEEIITSFLINNYSELMFLLNTPCDFAVEHDFVELLVYLNENNYNINENIILDAAGGGRISCLKYLHNLGYRNDAYACIDAAKNGHLDCLIFLHENGYPWNKFVCTNAVAMGQLECLRYAVTNHCPIDIKTCLMIVSTPKIKDYLLSIGK